MVPGIGPSPDKMLMGRMFSYHDTHLHRIGANYVQLPINAPEVPVHSYNKDGPMPYRHPGDQPVYAPNTYGGPVADPSAAPTELGGRGRRDRPLRLRQHARTTTSARPGTLYREVMSDTDREHLVDNIVGHASAEVSGRGAAARHRVLDPGGLGAGARVAAGLKASGNGATPAQAEVPDNAERRGGRPSLAQQRGGSGEGLPCLPRHPLSRVPSPSEGL